MNELLTVEKKAIDFHCKTQSTFGVHWEEALDEYLAAKSKGVPLHRMRTAYDKVIVIQKNHNGLLRQFDDHLASFGSDDETRQLAVRKLRELLSSFGGSLHVLSRRDVDLWLEMNELAAPQRKKLKAIIDGFLDFIKKSTLGATPTARDLND